MVHVQNKIIVTHYDLKGIVKQHESGYFWVRSNVEQSVYVDNIT